VLDQLNLTIPAGKMVALVGGSGVGKSTVASLLTRLYDPQSGKISIGNDSALQDMHPQDVRRKIGIVAQEPLLFPTTIEENIKYGSPNVTDHDVQEAARLAYVLEFTDQFPEGLKTVVGPRGTQLSGGQRQRVAVARCILKNPPIVVLDESTSALDSESEYQVQKAIDTACKGRTVILIAHRMSTIRSSDLIAVLMNGRVAEMGPFDELMNAQKNEDADTRGSFRRLMEKQLLVQA
jgi:ABC-type multidrug transport system fused ATPase/permease subunit